MMMIAKSVMFTECPRGYFKPECTEKCNCLDRVKCDMQTGKCPGDCYPGWTGDACNNCK